MTKQAEKKFDKAYDAAFRVQANCIQFNIMDLGKVRTYTRQAVVSGAVLETALDEAIAKFRKN